MKALKKMIQRRIGLLRHCEECEAPNPISFRRCMVCGNDPLWEKP